MTRFRPLVAAAPYLLAALFVGAGTLHFVRPQIYDTIVPQWAAPDFSPMSAASPS